MSIPVDSARFSARLTGNVNPAREWVTAADGSRSRSDVQPTNENGVPLWAVEMIYAATVYGEDRSETVTVTVPHPSEPKIEPFSPARFEGLTVEHYASKGMLRSRWEATGMSAARSADVKAQG